MLYILMLLYKVYNTFTGMTIIFIANASGLVKVSIPSTHCLSRLAYQLTFWVCFHVELSLLYASCSFSLEPAPKSQRNILRTMLENTDKKKEAAVCVEGKGGRRVCSQCPLLSACVCDCACLVWFVRDHAKCKLFIYISYYPDSPVLSSTTVWQLSDVVLETRAKEQNFANS